MRLVWKRSAKADRKEVFAYVEKNNLVAADTLDALFEEKASLLAHYPHMGRTGRLVGTREWVVHPSYILVYEVSEEAVHILRVLHTARRWP